MKFTHTDEFNIQHFQCFSAETRPRVTFLRSRAYIHRLVGCAFLLYTLHTALHAAADVMTFLLSSPPFILSFFSSLSMPCRAIDTIDLDTLYIHMKSMWLTFSLHHRHGAFFFSFSLELCFVKVSQHHHRAEESVISSYCN